MSDDAWPRLGELAEVKFAIAAVKRALGKLASTPLSATQRERASSASLTDLERELMSLMFVQARLSAVLLQMIEHYTADSGASVGASLVLETIQAHAQAQADLAALDDGMPFDAA